MRVNIIADSIIAGDAVGRHSVDLARAISVGNKVHIYYENIFTRYENDIRDISTRVVKCNSLPEADTTILQYAGWFPLAEQFKTAKGRKIFWYHGVTPPELWGTTLNQDLLVHSRFGAKLVHASDLAIVDSPFGGEELERLTGFPRSRIRVIPISTDLSIFQEKPSESQLESIRHHLHIEKRDVLLCVGRLAGNKRVDLIVKALHLLRDRFPALVLVVVGDTSSNQAYIEYADKLRQLARSLRLDERVILTGKVPSVSEYFHLASVYVLASEHEGFGVPLVEAMAAGVPIVACRSTAIPWVLGYDETDSAGAGLLFTAGAVEELAECISAILSNMELTESLNEKGYSRYLVFTPDRFRESVQTLLQEVTNIHETGHCSSDEPDDDLLQLADVALREYHIHSQVPVLGRLIEWIRMNITIHVKEAYLDRIVERQVMFNLETVDRVRSLQYELGKLRHRLLPQPAAPQTLSDTGETTSGGSLLNRSNRNNTRMLHNAIEIGAISRNFDFRQKDYLSVLADVALRDYCIHSKIPIFGKLIEWIRFNLTVHIKEAYLDIIIERQVVFNTKMADMILEIQSEIQELDRRIAGLN